MEPKFKIGDYAIVVDTLRDPSRESAIGSLVKITHIYPGLDDNYGFLYDLESTGLLYDCLWEVQLAAPRVYQSVVMKAIRGEK